MRNATEPPICTSLGVVPLPGRWANTNAFANTAVRLNTRPMRHHTLCGKWHAHCTMCTHSDRLLTYGMYGTPWICLAMYIPSQSFVQSCCWLSFSSSLSHSLRMYMSMNAAEMASEKPIAFCDYSFVGFSFTGTGLALLSRLRAHWACWGLCIFAR